MERHLDKVVSPGFLIGLSALLLNDFVLKQQFHNGITGKLSDFAGLFIFPLFCSAFFPRIRSSIYLATAAAFGFWKSAYSQSFFDTWNSLSFFPIGRTVDFSDLAALVALPFSYAYDRISSRIPSPRAAIYLVAIISVFAFTATSFRTTTAYDNQYVFQYSKKVLLERIERLSSHEVMPSFWEGETFFITFDSCTADATVKIEEQGEQSVITLKEIDFRCPTPDDKEKMRAFFEKEFIDKLRDEPVTKSAMVKDVYSIATGVNTPATPPKPGAKGASPRR